jgi:hypothetical protein
VAFKCRAKLFAIAASVRWAEHEISIVYVRAALALARRLLVRLIGDRHGIARLAQKAEGAGNLIHIGWVIRVIKFSLDRQEKLEQSIHLAGEL